MVLAAAIPVVAGLRWPTWVTAVLGAAVVVLEAVQQLYQWTQGREQAQPERRPTS